jgi:hypothetical protein
MVHEPAPLPPVIDQVTPGIVGSVSFITTSLAATFPVLLTVIEKLIRPPGCTTELAAVFTIASAGLFGVGPGQLVTSPDALAFRFPLTAVFVNGPHVVGAVASIEIDT